MQFIIPAIFIFVFIYALIKKVRVYDSFSAGVGDGIKFTLSLLPCLAAIFMMCALFEVSGLAALTGKVLSPLFNLLGIPEELYKLVLIKPFSGSGSIAYLKEIIEKYGADSYMARCACVLFGSSETVFYISAVYFVKSRKNLLLPIFSAIAATLISTAVACLICNFL